MTDKGIKLIFSLWGHRSGWVSLPSKDFDSNRWDERIFKWPEDKSKIKSYIKDCVKSRLSVYWCPTVLLKPRRVKENVETKFNLLWADLDEASPKKIKPRPTVAWESSPGRYQGLWLLKKDIKADKAEKLNRDLTYSIGADKGGWDLTQVLRIPGLRNWKYKGGPKGKLMWDDGKTYTTKAIKRNLNTTEKETEVEHTESNNPTEILKRYSKQLPSKVYELFFTPEQEVSVGERSDRLWELECLLAESGVKTPDIINLVRMSPWNKFENRRNEEEQIEKEVYKAKEKVVSLGLQKAITFGPKVSTNPWTSYSKMVGMKIRKPEWLISDMWQDKSHGFIAGEPKTYKSVLATDIAVSVASGTPVLNTFPVHNPGPVLIIQEENHPYLVQDRLRKMATSKGLMDGEVKRNSDTTLSIRFPDVLPIHLLNQYGFNMTQEEDRDMVQKTIKRVKPALVIFDPLYLMLGGIDENSSKELRPLLGWLLQLRYTYDTGIMLIHHWNKAGISNRGGQRMMGSTTYHAWVESALYCSVKDEVQHQIRVEREFRSFPKPRNLEIEFKMGDPGEDLYEPQVLESNTMGAGDVLEIIKNSNGITEGDLNKITDWSRSAIRNFLEINTRRGLLKKTKGSKGRGKGAKYHYIK